MALPALNNQTAMGNLSLDDKSQILTSLVQSGKLQLANYGAINFNQNITQMGATATKESSYNSFGEGMVRALNEIKGILYDLNNTMLRYVESSTTSQQVTQNLLEAKAKDIEVKREDGSGFIGKENSDKFYKVFLSIDETLKTMVGDISKMGGGVFGSGKGFLGGLLSSLIPKLLKGFLFGAAGFGIYKLVDKWDNGKMDNSPWTKIKNYAKESLGIDFEDEGSTEDQGGTSTQTDSRGGTGTAATGTASESPTTRPSGGTTPTQTGTSGGTSTRDSSRTNTNLPTATRKKFNGTNNPDIASESDLMGLTFRKHKGLPIEVEKQIKKALAQRLQYIRKMMKGKTLKIVSGYRPMGYKDGAGAGKNSQHKIGKAVDVSMENMSENDKKIFIRSAVEAGIGGIGWYTGMNFIHIDIRPRGAGGRIARWNNDQFPKWAWEYIDNPGKYTMNGEADTDSETGVEVLEEKNENKDTGSNNLKPTADGVKTPTTGNATLTGTPQKAKENASPEQGTTASPEYEDEQEEVGEKVLTEPSAKKIGKGTDTNNTASKTSSKSSITGPEKVILDFVSASEGTTKYGYNTAFGGSYKPLTTMTVNQVRNLQRESAKKKGSSAMGRYQIMGFNIDRFLKSGAIKGTDLFDENTQDKLGKLFLKEDAKIDNWKSGKINNEEFGSKLAGIWAGIPDPKLGKKVSRYHPQKAKYDRNTLLATLDGAKTGNPETAIAAAPTNNTPEVKSPNQNSETTQTEQPEIVEEPKNTAETIADDITANVKEFGETIKNLNLGELKGKLDEELFAGMENLGKTFGLDVSRLKKLPKYNPEETIATAKLTPEVSESAGKTVEEKVKTLATNKEEKADKVLQVASAAQQQNQQPIVNVNAAGGSGGSEAASPVVGGITHMDVRDSVIHQQMFRKGSSARIN